MSDADTTRRRVLEAAGPIFAEKGFQAASVREIIEKAGANVAAINYHFGSKEQLYIETVKHAYESIADAVPLPAPTPGVPAERRLREFVRTFLLRLKRQPQGVCAMELIMREVAAPTAACLEFVRGFVRPTFDALLAILDDLLPANVPAEKRHLSAGSVVGQCLHYHHARWILPMLVGEEEYARYEVDLLADHITNFSLAAIRGLYPSPARGKRS
jgi:TetR/AcrR family transcriptional regulator, regulator of cefoperazone and chloramphenicol sensitivity